MWKYTTSTKKDVRKFQINVYFCCSRSNKTMAAIFFIKLALSCALKEHKNENRRLFGISLWRFWDKVVYFHIKRVALFVNSWHILSTVVQILLEYTASNITILMKRFCIQKKYFNITLIFIAHNKKHCKYVEDIFPYRYTFQKTDIFSKNTFCKKWKMTKRKLVFFRCLMSAFKNYIPLWVDSA